jgi:hypothetical protein
MRKSTVSFLVLGMLMVACGGSGLGGPPPDGGPGPSPDGGGVGPAPDGGADGGMGPSPDAGTGWRTVGPVNLPAFIDGGLIGSMSGKLNAFAIDPTNHNTMLVAGGVGNSGEVPTNAGIYRTTNGGATWQAAVAGLVDADGLTSAIVNALWMDPHQPTVVLAGTERDGIFRSIDGGQSWINVCSKKQVRSLAGLDGSIFAAVAEGVLVSTDDGMTFTVAQATSSAAIVVAAAAGVAYAGTANGTLYRFAAGAWTQIYKLPGVVHQIAIDPSNGQMVYAAVADGFYSPSPYASLDGGGTWTRVSQGGAQTIAFSAVVPQRIYRGGDGAMSSTIADGSATPTWTTGVFVDDLRDFYMFPNADGSDDRCFATSDQGIEVAENCSKKGSPRRYLGAGLSTNLVNNFAVSPDGSSLVAMLQDFGAAVSNDGGETWSQRPLGGLGENGQAAVNPFDPSQCYAFSTHGFFLSTDGCVTFTKTATNFKSFIGGQTANIWAFDSATSFYVVANTAPNVFLTVDGGRTFSPVTWTLDFTPTEIAMAEANHMHLLVGHSGGFAVSIDGGGSWTPSMGLPTVGVCTVAIRPDDEDTVLAVCLAQPGNSATAYRSSDGGYTFSMVGTVIGTSIWGLSGDGGVVYSDGPDPWAVAATNNGAYLSKDDGDSWERLDTKTITHHFTSARWVGGKLYLGTYGQGILIASIVR